jgi:hypothetical protein
MQYITTKINMLNKGALVVIGDKLHFAGSNIRWKEVNLTIEQAKKECKLFVIW